MKSGPTAGRKEQPEPQGTRWDEYRSVFSQSMGPRGGLYWHRQGERFPRGRQHDEDHQEDAFQHVTSRCGQTTLCRAASWRTRRSTSHGTRRTPSMRVWPSRRRSWHPWWSATSRQKGDQSVASEGCGWLHQNLKVLTTSRHSMVPRHRQQGHNVDSTPINSAHTAQYSFFTSAERIARAWLKDCITSLCVWKEFAICFDSWLILVDCCLTCRAPRAHHLPHSAFLVPQHQNTNYKRDNTIYSKNTLASSTSPRTTSRSIAIKNHPVVKTSRVAETRATHSPQVMSPRSLRRSQR